MGLAPGQRIESMRLTQPPNRLGIMAVVAGDGFAQERPSGWVPTVSFDEFVDRQEAGRTAPGVPSPEPQPPIAAILPSRPPILRAPVLPNDGYQPARPPVTGHDPDEWETFPGELHTGGPR